MCHLVSPHGTFQSHEGSNVTPPPTRYFQQTALLILPAQNSLTSLTLEINQTDQPIQEFCEMHMNVYLPRKTVRCNRVWES